MKQSKEDPAVAVAKKVLRHGVFLPAYLVALVAFGAVFGYYYWFRELLHLPRSGDPAVWGQFGDFIGGILNPLVAFMAFIWIARSYELQKVELKETRAALESSKEAQQQLADTTLVGIRLNALNIKLTALTGVAAFERSEIERLLDVNRSQNDIMLYKGEQRIILDVIADKRRHLEEVTAEQNALLGSIDKLEHSLL